MTFGLIHSLLLLIYPQAFLPPGTSWRRSSVGIQVGFEGGDGWDDGDREVGLQWFSKGIR